MRLLKLLICFLPTLLLFSCSKKDESPPLLIKTLSVTYDDEGAIVVGEIVSLSDILITEYGFACHPKPEGRNAFKWIAVGTSAKPSTFQARLSSDVIDRHNAVWAYMRAGDTFIYANEIRLTGE